MKCIQNTKTQEIKRVEDKAAEDIILAENNWIYIPKSIWKSKIRDNHKEEEKGEANG